MISRPAHRRPVPSIPLSARRGEEGATLVIALVVMISIGVLTASVVTFANTSTRSIQLYKNKRTEQYAGDSAMKAAINWVATRSDVGLDPKLPVTVPACVTTQNALVN